MGIKTNGLLGMVIKRNRGKKKWFIGNGNKNN